MKALKAKKVKRYRIENKRIYAEITFTEYITFIHIHIYYNNIYTYWIVTIGYNYNGNEKNIQIKTRVPLNENTLNRCKKNK